MHLALESVGLCIHCIWPRAQKMHKMRTKQCFPKKRRSAAPVLSPGSINPRSAEGWPLLAQRCALFLEVGDLPSLLGCSRQLLHSR